MEIFITILIIYVLYAVFKNKDDKVPKNHKNQDYFEPDFKVTTSYGGYNSTPKSKNKEKGRWVEEGESVIVGKHTITNGGFYYGGVLSGRYEGDISLHL